MNTTFGIRMEAIFNNYDNYEDVLRLQRECSRLDMDIISAIRRCERAGDVCSELHNLLDNLHNRIARVEAV